MNSKGKGSKNKGNSVATSREKKKFSLFKSLDQCNEPEKKEDYNKRLNRWAILFLLLYVLATISWIGLSLFYGINNKIFPWPNYICFMLLTGVIHAWIYSMLKYKQSRNKLSKLFSKSDTYKFKLLKYDIQRDPWPFIKGSDSMTGFIKIVYSILWFTVSAAILACCICLDLFGFGSSTNLFSKLIVFILFGLLIIGMFINHRSYFSSIMFCFFTREIANEKEIKCDSVMPWNSKDLRQLIGIASRSSMSFFAISLMYLLALVTCICTRGVDDNTKSFWGILLSLTIFLCSISFIIFTLIPKFFLNRKFREWKFANVEALENVSPVDEDRIEKIWSSNLPYVRMETVSGCIVMLINMVSLAVSIVTLIQG